MENLFKDKKICILNYGSGNISSVFNMLKTIVNDVIVSNSKQDIQSSSHLILPGVGAFGASMAKIRKTVPINILEQEVLQNKKPFLGICVGMQVLANKGYEFGDYQGLGWIAGAVEKIDAHTLPLPHIGWNSIEILRPVPLLEHFSDEQDFYFVHSFAFKEEEPADVVAKTEYGEKFTSVIAKDNIFGVQFHPEKSQKAGRLLLENFVKF